MRLKFGEKTSLRQAEINLTVPTGVTISHLIAEKDLETDMFDTTPINQTNLSKSIDALNKRFGKNTITFGLGKIKNA